MPMESQAERAYLHIHHPQIAAEFEAATPEGKKLPYHVKKKAEDMPQFGVQHYMPLERRRGLTDQEHADIDRGSKQWLPSIFQSYGTPLPSMLASPWKQGLLAGLAGAGVGGLAGASIGGSVGGKTPEGAGIGALIGALGLGGTAGLVQGLSRSAKNEGIVEMMHRLPENAVKRDLLSDPAYQADVKRENENDNLNKLLNVMHPSNLMTPGSLTLGKFSIDVLCEKLALFGPLGCPVAGCTEGNPCESCLKEQVEEKQSDGRDLMNMVMSKMKEHGALAGAAGALVGGTAGAATAPSGHGDEGFFRGAFTGGLTGLGALAGAAAGGHIGGMYSLGNLAAHPIAGGDYSQVGVLAGAGLGGLLGHHVGQGVFGKPQEEKRACYPGCTKAKPCKSCRTKKANAFPITPQSLPGVGQHDPFGVMGMPTAPPGASHPGPGAGPDPFHVLGGMAAQHGISSPGNFSHQLTAGDPFGVNGLAPTGGDPFGIHTPPTQSGLLSHLKEHGWKYGLGAGAAALAYHLATRKKEEPRPQMVAAY